MSRLGLELLSDEVECACQFTHGGNRPDAVDRRGIHRGDQPATLDFELQLPPAVKPMLAREGKLGGPQSRPRRHSPHPAGGVGITCGCGAQKLSSLMAKLVEVWPVGQSPHGLSPQAEVRDQAPSG